MSRIDVRVVTEGFLHPAANLERELVDERGLLHVPVAALDASVQFFHCSARSQHEQSALHWVLADASVPGSRGIVERVLCQRFPGSAVLFLRSQAIGRAVVDCSPASPLAQSAAAAVAVVMYSAAWDESEAIAIEGGGAKHVFAVGLDDAGHWAKPVPAGN